MQSSQLSGGGGGGGGGKRLGLAEAARMARMRSTNQPKRQEGSFLDTSMTPRTRGRADDIENMTFTPEISREPPDYLKY